MLEPTGQLPRTAPDNVSVLRQNIGAQYRNPCSISWKPVFRRSPRAAEALITAYLSGHKAIFFGNGGSAADAQHLAAEFLGRYLRERAPLPALALNTNTSAVTAIGNDYGYEQTFSRQLRALSSRVMLPSASARRAIPEMWSKLWSARVSWVFLRSR